MQISPTLEIAETANPATTLAFVHSPEFPPSEMARSIGTTVRTISAAPSQSIRRDVVGRASGKNLMNKINTGMPRGRLM